MTQPGSHVVFVCPSGFGEIAREPRKARVIVIHELLHTLGLGENPPSGHEITAGVQERCWRRVTRGPSLRAIVARRRSTWLS